MRQSKKMVLAALAMALMTVSGDAMDVAGRAEIVDGDTLVVGETTIRLQGIDAAESRRRCVGESRQITRPGDLAQDMLGTLAGGGVACSGSEMDPYGRLVAKCKSSNGEDIGRSLVESGLAWAFVKYSSDYTGEEGPCIATARVGGDVAGSVHSTELNFDVTNHQNYWLPGNYSCALTGAAFKQETQRARFLPDRQFMFIRILATVMPLELISGLVLVTVAPAAPGQDDVHVFSHGAPVQSLGLIPRFTPTIDVSNCVHFENRPIAGMGSRCGAGRNHGPSGTD